MAERWLVVCTGNTCRSPMMCALLAAELAAQGRAVAVESAGTGAVQGEPASAPAQAAMAARGIDLSRHRSRPLPADLSPYARIWCMTGRHAAAVRQRGVPPERIAVLMAEHGGVADPWGGDEAAYAACADLLAAEAARLARTIP